MKVLHLETGRHLYGGARQVLYLMRGLAALGVDQALLCGRGSAIAAAARAEGLEVLAVPVAGDLDPVLSLRTRRAVARSGADLLHVHSRKGADLWGPLGAALAGVPVVITRRVDNRDWWPLVRLKTRLARQFAAISLGVRGVMVADGVPAARITLIHSAIDLESYSPDRDHCRLREDFGLPADSLVMGVIAQLIDRKGHRDLLETLPELVARFPHLRLLVFGQGPLRASLEARVRDLGLVDTVVFAGFDPELQRRMACFDLVVHPARREGLGVALLEAAASGVPIVACAAGGIPEAVRDGVNGILVPPADSAALGRAIAELAADAGRRRALGAAGRALMEREFSIPAMSAAYRDLYREVLAGGPAGRDDREQPR